MNTKFKFVVSYMVPGIGFQEVAVNAPCREAAIETVRMHYPQSEAHEIECSHGRVATH